MKIRLRRTDDLDEVLELDRTCFPHDKAMDGPELHDSLWWLAEARTEEGWEPVGYAGLQPMPAEGKAFLCRVGVLQEARGMHLQRRLIDVRVRAARRLEGVKRVYSYVAVSNIASARSLVRCGFLPYWWTRDDSAGTLYYFQRDLTEKKLTP